MAVDPQLAALAQAASNDPNNPYLSGQPVDASMPNSTIQSTQPVLSSSAADNNSGALQTNNVADPYATYNAYTDQANTIQNNSQLSYQQKLAQVAALGPAPQAPAPPPLSPRDQLEADLKSGNISYQQYLKAADNPDFYVNPNTKATGNSPVDNLGTAPLVRHPPNQMAAQNKAHAAAKIAGGTYTPPEDFRLKAQDAKDLNTKQDTAASQNFIKSLQDQSDFLLGKNEVGQFGATIHTPGFYEKQDDQRKQLQAQDALEEQQQDLHQYHAMADAKDNAARIDHEAAELRQEKPDPQKWFKDRGTAGSILAAIAVGLGAFGAAVPHTASHQNYALDIISKSIDRDVDAQKDNIENKWKALNFKASQNDKAYARDQFVIKNMSDARATGWSNAIAMMEKQAASVADQTNALGLQQMIVGARREKTKELNDGVDQRTAVLTKIRAEQKAAAEKNQLTPREYLEKVDKIIHDEKLQPPQGTPRDTNWARSVIDAEIGSKGSSNVGVLGVDPNTVKQTGETAGKLASFGAAINNIQDLIDQRTKNGGGTLSPTNTATMKGIAVGIRMSLDHAFAGRVTDTTLGHLKSLIPEDPNEYSPLGTTDAQLASALRYVKNERDQYTKELGGRPEGGVPGAVHIGK